MKTSFGFKGLVSIEDYHLHYLVSTETISHSTQAKISQTNFLQSRNYAEHLEKRRSLCQIQVTHSPWPIHTTYITSLHANLNP
jgi:hypothetical protein